MAGSVGGDRNLAGAAANLLARIPRRCPQKPPLSGTRSRMKVVLDLDQLLAAANPVRLLAAFWILSCAVAPDESPPTVDILADLVRQSGGGNVSIDATTSSPPGIGHQREAWSDS